MSLRIYIYSILIGFTTLICTSQPKVTSVVLLKSILEDIEREHQVTFNYLENTIATITLLPPERESSLTEKLKYLEKNTNLTFEIIDNEFIIIHHSKNHPNRLFCGYVYDKSTLLPIENTHIYLEGKIVSVSDNQGFFEVSIPENAMLFLRHISYKPLNTSVNLNENDCTAIYLEHNEYQLNEIVIKEYLTAGISKAKDGSFVIHPKDFGLLPGLIEADVFQTIRQIPGIYSTDESVSSINIRGGTHDQNLFLWNGIKLYQTGHLFGLISTINPYLSNEIKIYKNGSSAFYGESVSGVIDISTTSELSDKKNYSFGLNMINADLFVKQKINENSFIEIAGRKSITDWLNTPTFQQYYNKAFQNNAILNYSNNENILYLADEKFGFYDITLKYFNQINSKNKLVVDFITIKDNLKITQKNSTYNPTVSNYNTLYQKNDGINISWIKTWNSNNSSKINIYNSQYELDAQNSNLILNSSLKQENSISDFGLKIENEHLLNSKFQWYSGYQFTRLKTKNLDQTNTDAAHDEITEKLNIHSVIVEGKFEDSISRTKLSVGLRTNYIEPFQKLIAEPRLQFNYEIYNSLFLNVLGEFKSQNTVQTIELHNDYFGIEKRRWMLSNDNAIPVQRSKQISFNLTFKKRKWLLSAERFYKIVNGITTPQQGFQNQLEFVYAIGKYNTSGYEFLIQKKISNLITWFSYSINENKYDFPDLPQPVFTNNFEIDHLFSFATIYNKNNLKFAFGASWHSGKPETSLSSDQVSGDLSLDYNSPNNKYLNSFFQMDTSASYEWNSENNIKYSAGCSLINILNKQNEINEYYKYSPDYNTVEEIRNYALRRTLNVNFRIEF
ncbi:TonB-dependent receptor plug domain-containing protein [Flavobacterium sp. NRK F10]|uniref:TonB-dependent receptor plug domain-containing protein n=1 Tax=Flavobacterium sp. NRK F10 TaxID=2954931 RepID=UPI0020900BA9|nr:TonB-dependent receptor plug domain-containing protein [Flavobacterium sp. NRK F10]MCO6174060.1 TonB-dependent receptor plug domain-containing protein [Flavobacterium sp. NRK F10]